MTKWLVVYSSLTGNTKEIAEAIYEAFGQDNADIYPIKDKEAFNIDQYDNIAVGYWLTRGGPDQSIQELLAKLNNKTVVLFQTQGAELNSEHSITAFARAASYLGNNCRVLGTFASQGKINPAMLARRRTSDPNDPHAATERNIKRWENASTHPDAEDIKRAKDFVTAMNRKLELRAKYLAKQAEHK